MTLPSNTPSSRRPSGLRPSAKWNRSQSNRMENREATNLGTTHWHLLRSSSSSAGAETTMLERGPGLHIVRPALINGRGHASQTTQQYLSAYQLGRVMHQQMPCELDISPSPPCPNNK